MIVVSDSSPLIALEHLGRLHLLTALFGEVLIPRAVASEVAPRSLPAAIRVLALANPISPQILHPSLGRGETEVLAIALEHKATLVLLDDRAARRVATSLGLTVSGTLGILLDAKREGLVAEVKPLMRDLRSLPFHISNALYAAVLRQAGEG